MIGFAAEDLVDLRRWTICGAIVVLTHGGIAAAMVNWRDSDEAAEPAAAIVIEFAPVPVAPAMPQMEIPPGPEQVVSDASPNKPTESLEEKIEEKIEQKVEAKLEQKIEEKVDSKPVEEPPPEVAPAPMTSAPQAIPEQTAAIPAAPTQGQITPQNSPATVKWRGQVVALIERNKHYPETSARRGERGVAQVFFSLDRRGRVLESRVVRSSGASALDEEALALLRRAQPFPPPPPEFPGDSVTLILPLRFAK